MAATRILVVNPTSSTQTRLVGPVLILARSLWILGVVISVLIFAASVYARVQEPFAHCQLAASPEALALCAESYREAGLSQELHGWMGFTITSWIALVLLGSAVLIFAQRSDEPVPLFVSLALAAGIIGGLPGPLRLAESSAQFGLILLVLRQISRALYFVMGYIFPNGRFEPRWLRWPLAILITAVSVVSLLEGETSPAATVLRLILILGTAPAQMYRYARVSNATERQQTKWTVIGFAITIAGGVLMNVPQVLAPSLVGPLSSTAVSAFDVWYKLVTYPLVGILVAGVPVSIALAVLRFRLWDTDPIINRGLVYGGVTLLLVLVFTGLFFVLRAGLQALFGSDLTSIAAVGSTAAVVVLFTPARDRLRRLVDRRLYGIVVDYHRRPEALTPSPIAGRLVFDTPLGRYENLQPLGGGGMSEIYRAQHPTLHRSVAIKVLPLRLARREEYRRRFEREARAMASLKHPNIVQIYDYGEVDGILYIVMEHVQGPDLGDLLAEQGAFPLEQVREIIGQLAGALDYAHAQGIVHRDIKPSNTMLEPVSSPGGAFPHRVVLMDFGLAKLKDAVSQLTHSSGVMGTLDYIAPEQIHAAGEVDGRADVYALGVMTYHMLTGDLPFKGASPLAQLMMHLHQPPPDVLSLRPDLPVLVGAAVMQALVKDPAARYATAGAFAAALG